jgi:hypothetical protein
MKAIRTFMTLFAALILTPVRLTRRNSNTFKEKP